MRDILTLRWAFWTFENVPSRVYTTYVCVNSTREVSTEYDLFVLFKIVSWYTCLFNSVPYIHWHILFHLKVVYTS